MRIPRSTNLKQSLAILLAIVTFSGEPIEAREMTFEIEYGHTNMIFAEGEITKETPQRFKDFIKNTTFDGFRVVIGLNSDGGDLLGGIAFGAQIRSFGFQTDVRSKGGSAVCLSACSLAFLGGEIRELYPGSKLGFHQFYSDFNSNYSYEKLVEEIEIAEAQSQVISAILLKYMLDMGATTDLFYKVSTTLPNDMYIPNEAELLKFGLTTTTQFHKFSIEPYKKGIIAFSKNELNARGRDVVTQITTLCEGGENYILLTASQSYAGFATGTKQRFLEQKKTFTLQAGEFNVEIPIKNIRIYENSNVMAAIRIPKGFTELMIENEFSGRWTITTSGQNLYFSATPDDEARKMIAASYRHCYK